MAQTYSDKPTLSAWNALAEAAAGAGNCKIAYGTYTGDGMSGSSYPNTITVDFQPKLLIVQQASGAAMEPYAVYSDRQTVVAIRGLEKFQFVEMRYEITLIWEDNAVKWYNAGSPNEQFNVRGTTYAYLVAG